MIPSPIQIPRPERPAIHKPVVADLRKDMPGRRKVTKDRQQAAALMAGKKPYDLADTCQADGRAGLRAWPQATLDRLPQTGAILKVLLTGRTVEAA